MIITEVRIKLMDEPGERLRAFCSITFDDCFVVRDLKIIEGASGLFVAMPSRKLTAHCGKCGMKNHLRAAFCNQCGARLGENRILKDADGRTKLYADIAHPINSSCREMIQSRVVAEYHQELELAKSPNYVSRYDDFDAGDYVDGEGETTVTRRVDAPHAERSANRPHQPPEGQPSQTNHGHHTHGPSAESTRHTRAERGNNPNGENDASEPTGEGFGAGIF